MTFTSAFIARCHAVSCKNLLHLSFRSSCNRRYVMDEFIFNRSFLCVKLLILTEFATKLTFDDFKFNANYGRETDGVYVTAH